MRIKKLIWQSAPPACGWNKLRSLRKNRGLSQAEVAVGAGVSLSLIYFLECGFESRVREETKKIICDYLQVDLDDLFPYEMIGNMSRDEYLKNVRQGNGLLVAK